MSAAPENMFRLFPILAEETRENNRGLTTKRSPYKGERDRRSVVVNRRRLRHVAYVLSTGRLSRLGCATTRYQGAGTVARTPRYTKKPKSRFGKGLAFEFRE